MELTLEWKGPFGFVTDNATRWVFDQVKTENGKGLYLQVLPIEQSYYVHYVGVAQDLENRLWQHATGFLSGGYWFYDVEKTIRQRKCEPIYDPAKDYKRFLSASSGLHARAFEWLAALRVFVWRDYDQSREQAERELMESALIQHLFNHREDCGAICDNQKISRYIQPGHSVKLNMTFPGQIPVKGLMDPIHYPAVE